LIHRHDLIEISFKRPEGRKFSEERKIIDVFGYQQGALTNRKIP